jgi:hypothetical protein
MVPVDVTARDGDTGAVLALHSQVADETDIGMPLGSSQIAFVAPLQIAQAATDVYNGAPANESGHMCLSVAVRELRKPLRFCNRYVTSGLGVAGLLPPALALATSIDATTALSLIDQEQFMQLHVTRVTVQLDAERGLREASIISAHAPLHVRAGKQVTVRLLVQVVRGRPRTVTLRLRIPPGARGLLLAKIVNPTSQSSAGGSPQALAQALASALGGGPGGSPSMPPPPTSLAGLRNAFAGVSIYDGLELHLGRRRAVRIYRDPGLLITGQARLVFQVKR